MSEASEALAEAQRRVEEALSSGADSLDLHDLEHLEELPRGIRELAGLVELSLGGASGSTKISNIAALDHLFALESINLNGTQVVDIAPLRNLPVLRTTVLSYTKVVDITPLRDFAALEELYLFGVRVTDFAPLQYLTKLEILGIGDTLIMDVAPLKPLTALQTLYLYDTQIADISPLQDHNGLQQLFLHNTQLADLTPLQNLADLRTIYLNNTNVADLRPLLKVSALNNPNQRGQRLYFQNTAATAASPDLKRLSKIDGEEDRIIQTLAYLRTLPPYPEPLPWEQPTDLPPSNLPTNILSPITTAEINGKLTLIPNTSDTDPDGTLMARQGWHAITDYLKDLADQRNRIDNAMPRLSKAMNLLESSLGDRFENLNAIAAGTQGNRFIRLSRNAHATLMEDDAEDIAEFAAALTLFLERFPEWRAYRDAALSTTISQEEAIKAAELTEDVAHQLEDHAEIDPAIPLALEEQSDAVKDDPEDLISTTGLLASVGHVVSSLAGIALPILKWAKSHAIDIAQKSGAGIKKVIAAGIVGGTTALAAKATGFLATAAPTLHALALQHPQYLGWLTKFLTFFGL